MKSSADVSVTTKHLTLTNALTCWPDLESRLARHAIRFPAYAMDTRSGTGKPAIAKSGVRQEMSLAYVCQMVEQFQLPCVMDTSWSLQPLNADASLNSASMKAVQMERLHLITVNFPNAHKKENAKMANAHASGDLMVTIVRRIFAVGPNVLHRLCGTKMAAAALLVSSIQVVHVVREQMKK